jgi:hypothetical protein
MDADTRFTTLCRRETHVGQLNSSYQAIVGTSIHFMSLHVGTFYDLFVIRKFVSFISWAS